MQQVEISYSKVTYFKKTTKKSTVQTSYSLYIPTYIDNGDCSGRSNSKVHIAHSFLEKKPAQTNMDMWELILTVKYR